jgi:hypothetical protein
MVFGHNGLPFGPGNACISIELAPTCRKAKGGKTLFLPDGGLCDSIPGENSKSEARISKQIDMLEIQGDPF